MPKNPEHSSSQPNNTSDPNIFSESGTPPLDTPPLDISPQVNAPSQPDTLDSDLAIENSLASGLDPSAASLEQQYRHNLTRESIREYPKDRAQENLETLNRLNPSLAKVYRDLIQEFPHLKRVKMNPTKFDPKRPNANFNPLNGEDRQFSSVQMDFAHPEIYTRPENFHEGETFGLERAIKSQALKIGVTPRDMMSNQKLVNAFILAHELGHAQDFHDNYLTPEIANDPNPLNALPRALSEFNAQRRRDLMTQPLPGQIRGKIGARRHAFSKRLRALGIDPNNKEHLVNLQKRSYREMSSEAYADDFAAAYIIRHRDDFFTDPDHPEPDKIPTHFGELMDISRNADLLGLDPGRAVELIPLKVEQNGRHHSLALENGRLKPASSRGAIKGFLDKPIAKGQPISLYKTGIPEPRDRFADSAPLNGIFIRPIQTDQGHVENEIVLTYASPRTNQTVAYLVKIDPDREPPKVTVSPDEMTRDLGLSAGSKVQLMKRRLRDDSKVDESAIIAGELYCPDHWGDPTANPIRLDHAIYVRRTSTDSNSDPNYFLGGNTSAVMRIYRQWRSYFVETMTSTYEIIPYDD